MYSVNENYLKLPGSYLFSNIAKKVAAFSAANPDAPIIRLGIGDVTQPLAPAIIEALHSAVDEMAHAETFHGYAPDLGYEFLRSAIAKNDFQARGCDIAADEIFISDGAKSDSGNIQEIFGPDCRIAVGDPGISCICGYKRNGRTYRNLRSKDRNMEQCNLHALYSRKWICTGTAKRSTGYDLFMLPEQSDRSGYHKR